MPLKARLFAIATSMLGLVVVFRAFSAWQNHNMLQFICYLALALMSSSLNIKLPGLDGTMSANFLFILIGIADLSFAQTLAIGMGATLVQCFWKHKNPIKPIQVLFNLGGMMPLAIGAAYAAYTATGRYVVDSLALMLLAAGCTYFVANTLPVAVAISLSDGRPFSKIWSECYFWSFPYYLVGATIAVMVRWANTRIGWETSLLILPVIYWVYRSYHLYLGRLEDEKRHVEQMASLHLRTIEALALAIDAKDHSTHQHLQRVRVYAVEIAKELGINEEGIEALRAAALLHDIGKLAVPEHILNKPGQLTAEEFEKMKIHPMVGAEILERVQFPYPVAPIVRMHHERWDGNGYPAGLKGEQILPCARILKVVDYFDALSSDRQYRRALSADDAMASVVAGSGTEFDPAVVEILQRRYRSLEGLADAEQTELFRPAIMTQEGLEKVEPASGVLCEKPASEDVNFLFSIAAARQEAQALFELSHDLGNSLSLDETLSVVAMRLSHLVPYDSVAIYIRRSGEKLVPHFVAGDNFRILSSLEIPIGEGVSGWAAQHQKPMINADPALEPGYKIDASRHTLLRSAAAIPLTGVNGVVGVLTLYRDTANAFTSDHVRVLMAVSSKLALSIENALKYEQAESSATTDFLTGLPNARSLFVYLDRELSRCRRTGENLAVMVCDLNGFKAINDRYGHLEGNRVLQLFAQTAKEVCRGYDYIARMGGDEFVVISAGMTRESADKRFLVFNGCANTAGEQICGERTLGVSMGAAFWPEDGDNAEDLLDTADKRMYKAKEISKAKRIPPMAVDLAQVQVGMIN
jgi:diguanylate cyclase (GGDEF)-like protein/putative nucleotidyltransferase with HDIG domain